MANGFDIKMATSLVQPYDGSPACLDSFVDSINLLIQLTTEAQMNTAVQFVKTRLNGKARLTLPTNANTLADIIKSVQENCGTRETPDTVVAKLKSLVKTNDSEKFLNEVEQLTTRLTSLYMKDEIPAKVATKMATKLGVETLVEKTGRLDMKLLDYPSIQVAIQKYNETAREQSSQIFVSRSNENNSNFRGRNHPRGNYYNRGGQRPSNFQGQTRNQYQPNGQNRGYSLRPNFSRGRGHYNRYQQSGQRDRYQHFDQRNARVYYAQHVPENAGEPTMHHQHMMQQQHQAIPHQFAPQHMMQQQHQAIPSPNQNFLGTVRQYTQ